MSPLHFPNEPAQKILETITKRFHPCSVYIFGYNGFSGLDENSAVDKTILKAHHYYILVVTSKAFANGGSNTANAIAEQSGKTITATILLHKPTDFATKNTNQQRFFDNVLRNSHRLCLDKTAPPYIANNTIPTQDIEADKTFWLKCVAVAQFSSHAAAESPHLDVERCKIALLNTACTQIALGLIRLFMGYTPKEYGLNYLLQLCGHFTTLPAQIFGGQSPEGNNRYKMLCAPPSMLNHWTKLETKEEDFNWLLDACRQFIEQSNEMAILKINNAITNP